MPSAPEMSHEDVWFSQKGRCCQWCEQGVSAMRVEGGNAAQSKECVPSSIGL